MNITTFCKKSALTEDLIKLKLLKIKVKFEKHIPMH